MVLDLTRLWTSHVMPFMMTLRKETGGACSWATHAQLSKLQPLILTMREPLPLWDDKTTLGNMDGVSGYSYTGLGNDILGGV